MTFKEKCDEFIKKTMDLNDIPGLVIGVSFRGEEWTGAAGVRDVTDKDPLLPSDVFHCASVSKLLTSISIMKLVEEGMVSLEDSLCDLLPDLGIRDERWKDIRLYHMMSHTSGLGDVDDYHWEEALTGTEALCDYVHSNEVVQLPLLCAPGEGEFRYSNIAYEILGHIVAVKSGMSYEDFVRKNVLEPAGMTGSTMKTFSRFGIVDGDPCSHINGMIRKYNRACKEGGASEQDARRDETALHTDALPKGYKPMALPHVKLEDRDIVPVDVYPYTRSHGPSSTLTSTAADLLKLARANMTSVKAAEDEGTLGPAVPFPALAGEGHALLSIEAYRRIVYEYATVPNNGEKMGLGWFMRKQSGYKLYGHEGTDDGFRASLWFCPELDLAIAVLSNMTKAPVKKISKKLFDELI